MIWQCYYGSKLSLVAWLENFELDKKFDQRKSSLLPYVKAPRGTESINKQNRMECFLQWMVLSHVNSVNLNYPINKNKPWFIFQLHNFTNSKVYQRKDSKHVPRRLKSNDLLIKVLFFNMIDFLEGRLKHIIYNNNTFLHLKKNVSDKK